MECICDEDEELAREEAFKIYSEIYGPTYLPNVPSEGKDYIFEGIYALACYLTKEFI